jgi:hypothetical protein
MAQSGTIAFIADEFELRTPAQQLVDRFLIGYPFNGKFQRPNRRVVLHLTSAAAKRAEIEQRVKDFGLVEEPNLAAALRDADSVVVAGSSAMPVVEAMRPGAKCFIYGALTNSLPLANDLIDKAHAKNCAVLAGTATRGAIPLPPTKLGPNTSLGKGLIIVQGSYPTAELEALEGLLPLIADRRGARSGVEGGVQFLSGSDLWPALKEDFWPLVKSAISRSDTPQGDAVLDGRTQDLVRLGVLESLAKNPRAWLVEYRDGFVFAIVVLDGVLADYNFALETKAGGIISAQLYRPPPPGEHHYSNLAAALDRFFATGNPPWPLEQNFLTVELLQAFSAGFPGGKPA